MRIVAGLWAGKDLMSPGKRVRATAEDVRDRWLTYLEPYLEGARVVDLFAGSGALGLEALSRGADFCVFIDDAVDARGLVRNNVERTHMSGQARISRRDAGDLGAVGKYQPFDLAFADPPYGKGLGEKAAASALAGGWLKPQAVMVIEEAADALFAWPDGFEALDERRYGDTVVRIGRAG